MMRWLFHSRFLLCKLLLIALIGLGQLASPAYAQGTFVPAFDQASAIDKITEISKQLEEPGLRGQHPKGHGVVWAEFTVAPDIPENLRVGLFQEPGKTFPAWIRFSNSVQKDDTQGGAHGMAIKLMGVDGEKVLESEKDETTQDFILIDHPVFFVRNLPDYADFTQALAQAPGKPPLKFFFPGLNPLHWRSHELVTILALQRKKIANPLAAQYWSTTPYQFGAEAVKFSTKPTHPISGSIGKSPDYLRSAMADYLKTQDASFDFLIQLQTDPAKMPIDDPTIEWSEQASPLQKVATIRIPSQGFSSPEQIEFGENLSFTPWHSLPEHAPLGDINQARKAVYEALSEQRHRTNEMVPKEPSPDSFTPDLLAS